jgi:ABC-type uncharacterized transport system auxiliary subunit
VLIRPIRLAAVAVLLAGFVAGCGSARPVKYYVLDAGPVPTNAPSSIYPVSLLVGRVMTSHLYRDDRLVYGSGPVQLGVYSDHRWAQTPADMIQDQLIASLRSTGQYRSVSRLGSSARGEYVVRSNLEALYEVDQPALVARFVLRVELFDSKAGATVWVGNYSHDEPVNGKNVAAVVEAMNTNVRAGMLQLSSGISQYFAAHPPQQPAAD